MSWKRNIQNWDAKAKDKSEHSAARWALEHFRNNPEAAVNQFPDLRRWVMRHSYGGQEPNLNLSGYRYEDISPLLTREEYDRFETAYRATPEGQSDTWYKVYASEEGGDN